MTHAPETAPGRPRRGFALALTVVALALLGVLAAGVALTATRELRAGRDALGAHAAFGAAEFGLVRAESRWDRARAVSLGVGDALAADSARTSAGAVIETRVIRTARWLFHVVATAVADPARPRESPRTRSALVLRADVPAIPEGAALTAAGDVRVEGSALVSGVDAPPATWPSSLCAHLATGGGGIGVAAPDTTRVCGGAGCAASSAPWIVGAPAEEQSMLAAMPSTFTHFGDHDWATLAARADVVLPAGSYVTAPVDGGGSCDASAPLNWGDPARAGACGDRFVLVHVPGDLVLQSGSVGQGILLVEGDVRLEGPVTFLGAIVTRRDVVATGSGVRVLGAVLAADEDGGSGSHLDGDARLSRSVCALERAALGTALVRRVRGRPWTEVR
jgi:hypothetical protein